MAEATDSVHLTNLRTRRQIAIAVIVRRAAIRETKAEINGKAESPQPSHTATSLRQRRAIYATTSKSFAEAQAIVARWEAEGFFDTPCKTYD